MNNLKIKCGRCQSEFETPPLPFASPEAKSKVACPLCGYSRQDVTENKKDKKTILKG